MMLWSPYDVPTSLCLPFSNFEKNKDIQNRRNIFIEDLFNAVNNIWLNFDQIFKGMFELIFIFDGTASLDYHF